MTVGAINNLQELLVRLTREHKIEWGKRDQTYVCSVDGNECRLVVNNSHIAFVFYSHTYYYEHLKKDGEDTLWDHINKHYEEQAWQKVLRVLATKEQGDAKGSV